MRGDHDELEIFLEILLIHFTNRSKVEKIRREIHAFKGKISPKIMGNWCGRGSGFEGLCERFLWMTSWLQSRDESSPLWHWISPDCGHDRAAIGPQSRGDRALIARRSSCDRGASINVASNVAIGDDRGCDRDTIVRRSGHDRVTIRPRSRDDRGSSRKNASHSMLIMIWWRSDAPASFTRCLSDGDQTTVMCARVNR